MAQDLKQELKGWIDSMWDRELLRKKVMIAINKTFPYTAKVMRSKEDKYHQPIGEEEICTLIGVKYSPTTSARHIDISIKEPGSITEREEIRFFTVYSEESKKVQEGDIMVIDDIKYKVIVLGNTNEICFDMRLDVI